MSEENKVEKVEVTDVIEKTHTETIVSAAPTSPQTEESEVEKSKGVGVLNPVVILLCLILAMVVILVVTNAKRFNVTAAGQNQGEDTTLAAIKADVKAREMELNRQRMAMNLPPIEGGGEPIGDIASRLKSDADTIVALAARFQQMLGEKDAEINTRNAELLRVERVRQDLISENTRINSEYQRALISAMDGEKLKQRLADSQATNSALSEQLTVLRDKQSEMADAVNADEFTDLQRRYNETLRSRDFFENRVKELEAELGKMSLFAKSEEELLPAAVQLFRKLQAIEGAKDPDLYAEYSKLGEELGANLLQTLNFKTGSSELSDADKEHLISIAQNDLHDGDLALIIGYASKTGDAAVNEELSSSRATAAAKFIDELKGPGQLVQAAYLNQTDRFSGSTPELNEICEVWIIRKRD